MGWRVPRCQIAPQALSRHVFHSSAPPLRRRKWPRAGPLIPRPDTTVAASRWTPGVGVSSATSHGLAPICCGKQGGSRRGRERAGALNVLRPHQRPWPPHALTFKLKIRKPREHLDGYRYWNRSTEGLVAIAMREGGFWDHAKKHQRRLVLSVFPAHSFHLRATLRLRPC